MPRKTPKKRTPARRAPEKKVVTGTIEPIKADELSRQMAARAVPQRARELPESVPTAAEETAAASAAAREEGKRLREERRAAAGRRHFKLCGHQWSACAEFIGTGATAEWRQRMADAAGIGLPEGGYFYVTKYEGGFARPPVVWFEADYVDRADEIPV